MCKGSRLFSKMTIINMCDMYMHWSECLCVCACVCISLCVWKRSYQFARRRETRIAVRLAVLRACVGEPYPDQVTRRPVKGADRQAGGEALPELVPHPRSLPRVHGAHGEARALTKGWGRSFRYCVVDEIVALSLRQYIFSLFRQSSLLTLVIRMTS